MSWIGIITRAGEDLCAECAYDSTKKLSIYGASVGSGTVSEVLMRDQTAVTDEEDSAAIVAKSVTDNGLISKVQITAREGSGYTARQIGVWARYIKNGVDGPATLLALFQDDGTGADIPSKSTFPDFMYAMTIALSISGIPNVEIQVDTSALVSQSDLNLVKARVTALETTVGGYGTAAEADAANNLTTEAEGYVLDARQGKVLDDRLTPLEAKASALGNFSMTTKSAPANASTNYTIPNGYRGLVFIGGANEAVGGLYIVTAGSSGALTIVKVTTASGTGGGLTLSSTANNQLTIQNSSTYTPLVAFLTFTNVPIS